MTRQMGLLYSDVVAKVITDRAATRQAVLEGLSWIERQTTQYDVAMVYLSGHGVNDNKGNYYFASVDIDTSDLRATAVRFSDIADAIQSLADKTNNNNKNSHTKNTQNNARLKALDIGGVVNELASAEN